MPLTKTQKKKIIDDLKEKIAKQKAMIFVDFTGLKVKDLAKLRKKIKAIDSELKVVKKTLLGLVFKEKNLKFEKEKLRGEIAVIFGFKDELSPAKIIYQFCKENDKLKIVGGFIGNEFKEKEEIITLAQLPTREELIGELFAAVNYVSRLNSILQKNLGILPRLEIFDF